MDVQRFQVFLGRRLKSLKLADQVRDSPAFIYDDSDQSFVNVRLFNLFLYLSQNLRDSLNRIVDLLHPAEVMCLTMFNFSSRRAVFFVRRCSLKNFSNWYCFAFRVSWKCSAFSFKFSCLSFSFFSASFIFSSFSQNLFWAFCKSVTS